MNKFGTHRNPQFIIIIVYNVETRHPISIILTNLFKHVLKSSFYYIYIQRYRNNCINL